MKKKKYSVVDDHMPNKTLDKIKKIIGTENFDNTKILIDTDDKLLDNIPFKNIVILMTYVNKDDNKLYLQLF